MNRKRKNKLNLVRRKKPAWAKALQDQAAREQHELTDEEAQKAYDEAVPVELSKERIQEIVDYATGCRCIKCVPSGQQHHNGPHRPPATNSSE